MMSNKRLATAIVLSAILLALAPASEAATNCGSGQVFCRECQSGTCYWVNWNAYCECYSGEVCVYDIWCQYSQGFGPSADNRPAADRPQKRVARGWFAQPAPSTGP
jgi:hypothetical protein